MSHQERGMISSTSGSVSVTSIPGDMGERTTGSIEVFMTGALNGTLRLYASNQRDDLNGFKEVPSSSVSVLRSEIADGKGALWNLSQVGYRFVLVRWVPTAAVNNATYAAARTGFVDDAAYTSSGAGPYDVEVTSVGHGLNPGDVLTVTGGTDSDVNGSRTVLTTPTDDTFTFQTAGDPSASGTLDYVKTSNGYTVTVTSVGHGFEIDDTIKVSDGSNAAVNGTQTILTNADDDTFTFEVASNPGASGTLDFIGEGNVTASLFLK